MKVSSQVLCIAVLAGFVSANDRGRPNDWHKVTKPTKFKPNAPRNEGKVLRTDRAANGESGDEASNEGITPGSGYTVVNSTVPSSNEPETGSVNKNSADKLQFEFIHVLIGLFVL